MTNNTDPVRGLIGEMTEYLDQQVDPELDVIAKWRDRLEAALASAPPSAPEPEVHSYDPTDQRQSVTIRWPDGKCLSYVLDRTRYTDNLPPSAPVGGTDDRRERLLERRNVLNNSFGNGAYEDGRVQQQIDAIEAELAALAAPQQPAAVDEAAAIRAFEEHFEASAEDSYFEGELALWLTAWRKALAAQQQEGA